MLLKLCQYNNWANSLLVNALTEAVETHATSIPDYCITLLSHIANAQQIWSSRIRGTAQTVSVWQLHDLNTCKSMLLESGNELNEVVENDHDKDRIIIYKTSTGAVFETSVEDILLHVFNHGTYHRAQIARQMKESGLEPVNTDYIQYVRM
ncbi:DinB family protein [Pedobacter frigoris]|uniref:Damage-inducible protein DinB n=1 Tax=Pedobacter frigoris TaxID=2571272 RepID=A0A4U1CND0_9SPHI|nr:DinB family protein [Pedobacter frigoris]TKC06924.1 damage-inducible protein DinB [Pedobacter frigoris]